MIRLARSSDAAQILNIYAPLIRNTAITFEYEIPDVGDFEKRIEKTSKFYPYLVWEEHKNILGYTYATRFRERKAYDWICESAIYISEQARGKGIGQKLYLKLFECLRAQGIVSVIAIVRPHAKTVDFHEALGFRKAGVIPLADTNLASGTKRGFGNWFYVIPFPSPLLQ